MLSMHCTEYVYSHESASISTRHIEAFRISWQMSPTTPCSSGRQIIAITRSLDMSNAQRKVKDKLCAVMYPYS